MKVIVVGAGAAGLSAARELQRRGIDPLVLEAAGHVGGRIAAEEAGGFRIDTGAQVMTGSYGTAVRLCRELGLPLRKCSRRAGIWSRGRFRVLDPGDPLASLRTLLAFRLLSPRGLAQLFRLGSKLRACRHQLGFSDPSRLSELDTGESVAHWIRSHAGPELLEELGQAVISVLTLARPEEVGAAYGIALLWGFVFEPEDFLVPEGGMGSIARGLAGAVEGRIRLNTPVERIVVRGGTAAGVRTAEGFIGTDAVVCATTATRVRRLADLPAEIDGALGRVTYSSSCRVAFGVDRPVLPDRCYSAMLPRGLGSFLVGYSDAAVRSPEVVPRPAQGAGLILAESTDRDAAALSALSDTEVRARFLAEVRRWTPAMPKPGFGRVYRWQEAVCLLPGGVMTDLGRARRELPGRIRGLALAGEYMHLPSVEGALASGIVAVDDLLGADPRRRQAVIPGAGGQTG